MNVTKLQAYITNVIGPEYYTAGKARQLNGLIRLISILPLIETYAE